MSRWYGPLLPPAVTWERCDVGVVLLPLLLKNINLVFPKKQGREIKDDKQVTHVFEIRHDKVKGVADS
jgi:hypothetical protein